MPNRQKLQKNSSTHSHRRKKNSFRTIILILLAVVLVIAAILLLWYSLNHHSRQSSSENSSSQISVSSQNNSSSQISSEPISEVSDPGPDYSVPVPESVPVTEEYFNDAVFVGDSITDGIQGYGVMPNAGVVAHTGINLDTIQQSAVFTTQSGTEATALQVLQQDYAGAQKIYVMLGSNGIAWFEKDHFIEAYRDFLVSLKEIYPDSTIYVQSMFPVTAAKEQADSRYANAKITEYNQAIAQMAEELEVYYLNVAEAFQDESGCLPAEASPSDGMHFGVSYYQKWMEYLKCHTVQ